MAAPRKDNVKALILDATERLMESKKLSQVSLAEIADEAGVSKGTLYYHYKGKNEILFDLTDRYLDGEWNDLVAWSENPEKDTSLHRLVKYVLERDVAAVSMRLHFFYDAMLGDEALRERLLGRYREFAALIAHKIAQRTDKVSEDYLAWLILLLSDGLFIHKTLHNDALDVEDFIARTAECAKWLQG